MNLLDIPSEVIDAGVLPFLDWNDLLRLRRVCKWTKDITEAYIWVNPDLAPEIEINEGNEKTMKAFVALGIPTTKLFLNNQSGYSFYEKIDEQTRQRFLEKFGPFVKHLRVTHLCISVFGREKEIISGMKNLKSFEAAFFGNGRKNDDDEWSDADVAQMKISFEVQAHLNIAERGLPPNFKYLESIKIGQDHEFVKRVDIVLRSDDILIACPQLKYVCLPFDSTFKMREVRALLREEALLYEALPRAMLNLIRYTMSRPNIMYPSNANGRLECHDFQNFHYDNVPCTMEPTQEMFNELAVCWMASKLFLLVCTKALETGLKLSNVNPGWYCARFNVNEQNQYAYPPELGIPVVSLVGLDLCVMTLDMPNLKKITIPLTSGCVTGAMSSRPEWPALKELDITVDGKYGNVWNVGELTRLEDLQQVRFQATCLLFKFLFVGIVRTNMNELSIRFVEGKGKRDVDLPKAKDIVAACPNLKKIKLENWLGTNKQLVDLWKGLSRLEEISLQNCKELGNVAFVGEDVEFPVFLRLTSLKKLTLKGLDKMPKITDTFFSLVLSKMPLRELVLHSDKPLKQVTKNGLNALLGGTFAEAIERFPFRSWSMADMSAKEFHDMGKKFRSYDMM